MTYLEHRIVVYLAIGGPLLQTGGETEHCLKEVRGLISERIWVLSVVPPVLVRVTKYGLMPIGD